MFVFLVEMLWTALNVEKYTVQKLVVRINNSNSQGEKHHLCKEYKEPCIHPLNQQGKVYTLKLN